MNDISCDKLEVHVSYYNKDIYEQYASIEPRSKKKTIKSTSLGYTDDHFLIKMKMYC